VLQRLREVAQAAMTGCDQNKDRKRTEQAGFKAPLTEPVASEELHRALRQAAGRETS
jgi:CheY-like chemotaxis protein